MHTVNANGAAIPALGFGTHELQGATAAELVDAATLAGLFRRASDAQTDPCAVDQRLLDAWLPACPPSWFPRPGAAR